MGPALNLNLRIQLVALLEFQIKSYFGDFLMPLGKLAVEIGGNIKISLRSGQSLCSFRSGWMRGAVETVAGVCVGARQKVVDKPRN